MYTKDPFCAECPGKAHTLLEGGMEEQHTLIRVPAFREGRRARARCGEQLGRERRRPILSECALGRCDLCAQTL